MDDISTKALNSFTKNMKYFEENHKPIFEKISLLNQVIDEGHYSEHYALEYKEEGYFDILELSSNEFLYKENSIEHATRMANSVDLKRTGGIFKAQKYVWATEEQAERIDTSELSFHNSLWSTIKIINYVNRHTPPETYMNRVHKIIFLGIGLGLHLLKIVAKLNPQVIFIKEKNLETFRLSLFVTDYTQLAQDHFLYFSLTDDDEEEKENFIQFLDKGNNHNLNLKHIPFTLNYESELRRLQGHVLSQSYVAYGYSAMLLRFIDSPRYLAQRYSFVNVNKIHHGSIFSQKPVLLVFSGPSTLKNIEWLKANHHRFILVSALSTCKLLHHAGIVPNIVIHIDPGENSSLLFDGLDIKAYLKDAIVLLASNVDEKTVQQFDRSKIHFIEQGTTYKKDFGKLSAPSVGEYAYGLFLILGTMNMFMLGIDLALDNETLQSHGGFHAFQTKGKIDEKDATLDPFSSVEYVQGNFLDKVPTFSSYKISIMQVEIFTGMLKRFNQTIHNLSNGAYLSGCDPLKIEDYNWEQLKPLAHATLTEDLNNFFKTISSDDFNEEDKGQLKYQIKEAKKLEKIIKQHQKKKFVDAEAYLTTLAKLSWDLSDMEYKTHSDLAQVYYEYFPIVLSYIFDLFNTKELENSNKHITQTNTILVKQLLKISELYITKLEGYVK